MAEAQRILAARRSSAVELFHRATAAAAAIPREVAAATTECGSEAMLSLHITGDLTAWLPRGESLRQRAATEARLAEDAAEAAREEMVAARAAQRVVELLRARRADEVARKMSRRSQAMLDEMAARKLAR
ncbi:flagellar FliJ family protein [Pararoseomonas baculiformis]|uniref:flagellar FliJ family protein n=1 Tax=Pararoseomonas baculiformis TaxID=2820812 RepID=UPI003158E726